jgi:hypothetical protein
MERRSVSVAERVCRPPSDTPDAKEKLAWRRLYLVHFLLRGEARADLAELQQLLSSVKQALQEHPNPLLARELIPYNGIL